jgi:hypothetical protein
MDTVGESLSRTLIKPTSTQEERAARIRRFNLLYVYLPIGLLSLIVVVIVLFLLIYTLTPLGQGNNIVVAALADVIVIVYSVPLMILCAILPTAFVFLTIQSRKKGIAPLRQSQSFLWRVETELVYVQSKVKLVAQQIARPFLYLNGIGAFIQSFVNRLLKLFSRS